MFQFDYLAGQPLFYLFIAFSALLAYGYFWGKKKNHRIFVAAFNDLVEVVQPADQTFTNIGGLIGYHADLVNKKGEIVEKVEATITFLSRHSWLWLPISKLIWKNDRLFVTINLRKPPFGEGHLIESGYARFRGPKIANADRLKKETIQWGGGNFQLYYQNMQTRENLAALVSDNPDPGAVRHIALVPELNRCFIFMIPRVGEVARSFAPIYRWLPSVLKKNKEK
jgi:hypothetical protein